MQTWLLYYGVWLWFFGLGVSVLLAVALRSWWPSFVIRRRARHITRQIPPLRKEILIEEEQTFLGTLHAQEPSPRFEDGSPCAIATLCSAQADGARFTASKRLHLKVEGIEHSIHLHDPCVIIGSQEVAHDRLTARMPVKTLELMKEANLALNDFDFQISMRSLKDGDKVYARGKVKIIAAEGDDYRTPSTKYLLASSEPNKPLALFFQGVPIVVRRWSNLFVVGALQAIFLFSLASYLLGHHFIKSAKKQITQADTGCIPATVKESAVYASALLFTREEAKKTYALIATNQCYQSAEELSARGETLRQIHKCGEQMSLLRQSRQYQEAIGLAQSCEAPGAKREAALSYFALGYLREASQLITQEPNDKADPERITEEIILHLAAGEKRRAMESAKKGAELLEKEALLVGTQGKAVNTSSYPAPDTNPYDEPYPRFTYDYYPSSQAHIEIEDSDKKQPYLARRAAAFACVADYLSNDPSTKTLFKEKDRTAREECSLLFIEKNKSDTHDLLELFDTPDGATELGRFEPLGFDLPGVEAVLSWLIYEKNSLSELEAGIFGVVVSDNLSALFRLVPVQGLERLLLPRLEAPTKKTEKTLRSLLLYSKATSASQRQKHQEAFSFVEASLNDILAQEIESRSLVGQNARRDALLALINNYDLSLIETFVRSAVYTNNQDKLREFFQLLPDHIQSELISDELLPIRKQQAQLFFVVNEALQRSPLLLQEITEGDAWWAALNGDKEALASAIPRADPASLDALLWYAHKKGLGSQALLDWIRLGLPSPTQNFGVTKQLIDNHRVLWLTSLFGGAPDKELQGSIAPLEELLLRRDHAILLYILENPANFQEAP